MLDFTLDKRVEVAYSSIRINVVEKRLRVCPIVTGGLVKIRYRLRAS